MITAEILCSGDLHSLLFVNCVVFQSAILGSHGDDHEGCRLLGRYMDVTEELTASIALMIEAISASETSVSRPV